ncbi:MAG: glycoside hydrolase family 99-like domain-containing protein, partial [Desulfovibrionaceae bacterium]|nr:glycoside hydrolase family 99-like domain-containing protein [Desulfovibrionaceae bacterium]
MDVIAFYLPQFHPIPENDAIYGKGFTEWDNVRNAVPLFPGHYQPHVPHRSIGQYSLLDERFLAVQHALALECGVSGFCYYYYNFAGHTPLSQPLEIIRQSRAISNAYCLCWAHVDWYDNRNTRKEIFLPQTYSAACAEALFADLRRHFENPRYIAVNGKPLLLIWAPERNPMICQYADILREQSLRAGFPGLCLAGVECFVGAPPELYGLDCMV